MDFRFSDAAAKTISKLDSKTAGRIFKGIVSLPEKGDIKTLDGKHKGQFRLRIGDWRIIYKVENDIVLIAYILPRGDAYQDWRN